jgi:hypothetical protein
MVAAALAAPLTHLHDDDRATDHHNPHAVHAHLSGHTLPATPVDETEIHGDESERVVFLQFFVAVAGISIDVPAAVVTTVQLPAPLEAPAHLSVDIVHGHDPPVVSSLSPRAPPAILS